MQEVKKDIGKKKRSTMNQVQMAHAMNRLEAIYREQTQRIQNARSSPRSAINWSDKKQVTSFVTKYKLPALEWTDVGNYMFGNGNLPPSYTAINEALLKEQKALTAGSTDKLQTAAAVFAAAQDSVIFGDILPDEVPAHLENFASGLSEILSS